MQFASCTHCSQQVCCLHHISHATACDLAAGSRVVLSLVCVLILQEAWRYSLCRLASAPCDVELWCAAILDGGVAVVRVHAGCKTSAPAGYMHLNHSLFAQRWCASPQQCALPLLSELCKLRSAYASPVRVVNSMTTTRTWHIVALVVCMLGCLKQRYVHVV
jgi:hypothetical protein